MKAEEGRGKPENIKRFKPYPVYKHSGVEWLGEIPAHWEVKALKRLGAMRAGQAITAEEIELMGEYPVFGGNGVRGYTDSYTHDGQFPIVGRQGALCGCVNFAHGKFWASEHAVVVTPAILADAHWRTYLLVGLSLNQYSQSAAQPGLAVETISALPTPAPPHKEQRAIAAFLDRETARIDALVAKKERLIELLQEKRTALITRAVTKGLDPTVPMKDSGVEWLGEIPAHWEVKRLKNVVPGLTVGIVVTPSKYYVEEGVPCLRSLNIAQGIVKMTDVVFISPSANELHRKSKIFAGDVLVVRTGKAGAAVVVPKELDGANCIDLLIIRRSKIMDSGFLYHFINSLATLRQVEVRSVGAIQEHFNTGTLSELCLPRMPVHEQRAIAAFLDRETARIDALVAKIREAIERLKELRTALISAAVTGKIDVRHTA
jgi:type I restriction enzyme S subunit